MLLSERCCTVALFILNKPHCQTMCPLLKAFNYWIFFFNFLYFSYKHALRYLMNLFLGGTLEKNELLMLFLRILKQIAQTGASF